MKWKFFLVFSGCFLLFNPFIDSPSYSKEIKNSYKFFIKYLPMLEKEYWYKVIERRNLNIDRIDKKVEETYPKLTPEEKRYIYVVFLDNKLLSKYVEWLKNKLFYKKIWRKIILSKRFDNVKFTEDEKNKFENLISQISDEKINVNEYKLKKLIRILFIKDYIRWYLFNKYLDIKGDKVILKTIYEWKNFIEDIKIPAMIKIRDLIDTSISKEEMKIWIKILSKYIDIFNYENFTILILTNDDDKYKKIVNNKLDKDIAKLDKDIAKLDKDIAKLDKDIKWLKRYWKLYKKYWVGWWDYEFRDIDNVKKFIDEVEDFFVNKKISDNYSKDLRDVLRENNKEKNWLTRKYYKLVFTRFNEKLYKELPYDEYTKYAWKLLQINNKMCELTSWEIPCNIISVKKK